MSSLTRLWGLRTRALALALLCSAALTLGASTDRASNSLGQDLGPWQGESYRLLLEGGRRTLYNEDEVVFIEERREEGDRLITTRHTAGQPAQTTIFKDGQPLQQSVGNQRTLFQYSSDGRLELRTTLIDGVVDRAEAYTYHNSGNNGLSAVVALASVATLRTLSREGDDRVFAYNIEGRGESFTMTRSGLEVIQEWGEGIESTRAVLKPTEDGGFTLTKGDRIDRWDERGLLIETKDGGEVTNYQYNESNERTVEVRGSEGGKETSIYWEKGEAVRSEERFGGVLTKSTRYLPGGGRVETLYVKGEPYSDVTYGSDGARVLSIRYH